MADYFTTGSHPGRRWVRSQLRSYCYVGCVLVDRRDRPLSFGPRPNGPRWQIEYGIERDSPVFKAGVAIEERVFVDTLGYTPQLVRAEFEPYDELSVFMVLSNLHEGRVIGAIRALVGATEKLKVHADLHELWGLGLPQALIRHGIDPGTPVVECSSLAVLPSWRRVDGYWPFKALSAACEHLILDVGGEYSVQIQNVSGPRLVKLVLNLPFEILGDLGPADFLGPVIPTVSHVAAYPRLLDPTAMDPDYQALRAHLDQTVRGGTLLPTIDLRDEPSVLDLRRSVPSKAGRASNRSV